MLVTGLSTTMLAVFCDCDERHEMKRGRLMIVLVALCLSPSTSDIKAEYGRNPDANVLKSGAVSSISAWVTAKNLSREARRVSHGLALTNWENQYETNPLYCLYDSGVDPAM